MDNFLKLIQFVRISDCIDILFVAYLIYIGIKFVRETRAWQLLKGILLLFVIFQFSSILQLSVINYLFTNAFQVGIIALIVTFQPELRRALDSLGRNSWGKFFTPADEQENEIISSVVNNVSVAARSLSENRIGALMVIERKTKIGDIIRTGVTVDSLVSAELLVNIFIPKTPLHDGAVIIRGDRVVAAACILPLTQNADLSVELGTRHRAAIGISEASDAAVVVVSEETGKISLALDGSLTRNLTVDSLERALTKILTPHQNTKNTRKIKIWKDKQV